GLLVRSLRTVAGFPPWLPGPVSRDGPRLCRLPPARGRRRGAGPRGSRVVHDAWRPLRPRRLAVHPAPGGTIGPEAAGGIGAPGHQGRPRVLHIGVTAPRLASARGGRPMTRIDNTRIDNARGIRAPRGPEISATSWLTEAPLRMLMNNLDPEVAEKPGELVVYGGMGRAARDWESFDRIVAALRDLEADETLLVQSGKPVGIFRTHTDAPR